MDKYTVEFFRNYQEVPIVEVPTEELIKIIEMCKKEIKPYLMEDCAFNKL